MYRFGRGKRELTSAEVVLFSRSGGLLVVLQVNCRSIYNKVLEFWNLIDTYNPDVIIGTESWRRGDTENAEVFRADYTTFRRDNLYGEGGFLYVLKIPLLRKNCGLITIMRYWLLRLQ